MNIDLTMIFYSKTALYNNFCNPKSNTENCCVPPELHDLNSVNSCITGMIVIEHI